MTMDSTALTLDDFGGRDAIQARVLTCSGQGEGGAYLDHHEDATGRGRIVAEVIRGGLICRATFWETGDGQHSLDEFVIMNRHAPGSSQFWEVFWHADENLGGWPDRAMTMSLDGQWESSLILNRHSSPVELKMPYKPETFRKVSQRLIAGFAAVSFGVYQEIFPAMSAAFLSNDEEWALHARAVNEVVENARYEWEAMTQATPLDGQVGLVYPESSYLVG